MLSPRVLCPWRSLVLISIPSLRVKSAGSWAHGSLERQITRYARRRSLAGTCAHTHALHCELAGWAYRCIWAISGAARPGAARLLAARASPHAGTTPSIAPLLRNTPRTHVVGLLRSSRSPCRSLPSRRCRLRRARQASATSSCPESSMPTRRGFLLPMQTASSIRVIHWVPSNTQITHRSMHHVFRQIISSTWQHARCCLHVRLEPCHS